ncbi:hypothetical protein MTO96_029656, partial [Rhipicephalus appendiculatus]
QVNDDEDEEYIDLESDFTIFPKSKIKDNPDLIVYGETAEGRQRHYEWLTEKATTAEDFELWHGFLATGKNRHERHKTVPQALLEYPFLATVQSV